jgi:alkylhydroperoxidase family enzyme
MSLLSHVRPEEATGMVAEVYKRFPVKAGIPAPARLLSVSPDLLAGQGRFLAYYGAHERLDHHFLAMLRFLVATAKGFAPCERFNRQLLILMGMSEAEVDALAVDPTSAPLDEKHKALLLLALKSVATPEAVRAEDVQTLRAMGWTDQDILDASFHGALLLGPAVLCRAFGVE